MDRSGQDHGSRHQPLKSSGTGQGETALLHNKMMDYLGESDVIDSPDGNRGKFPGGEAIQSRRSVIHAMCRRLQT